jgi:hypothetical protein
MSNADGRDNGNTCPKYAFEDIRLSMAPGVRIVGKLPILAFPSFPGAGAAPCHTYRERVKKRS